MYKGREWGEGREIKKRNCFHFWFRRNCTNLLSATEKIPRPEQVRGQYTQLVHNHLLCNIDRILSGEVKQDC